MRIDPNVVVSSIAPIGRDSKESAPATETPTKEGSNASVVNLSSAAGTASAQPASSGITARLAAIKVQIESGNYPIDLDKLASRIVDDDSARGSYA